MKLLKGFQRLLILTNPITLVCELCILQLLSIKDTMTSLWVVVMVHSPLACSCSSKDGRIRPIFPSLRASRNFMEHFSFIFSFFCLFNKCVARDHSLYSAILFDYVTIDGKGTGQGDRSTHLVEEKENIPWIRSKAFYSKLFGFEHLSNTANSGSGGKV